MASKVESKELEEYLAESRGWETSQVLRERRSARTAWWVASAAIITAMGAIWSVAAMMPLKRTELRTITVDNATGIVNDVTELKDAKSNYSEVVNKYFAQLYVRYREGYSRDLAEDYYNDVGLMSSSSEQRRYAEMFSPKNPQSPLNVYGANTKVKIRFKSVSFIKDNIALVRYLKEVDKSASERPTVSHWAATIIFKYVGTPMTEKERAINPLGFQVVEYRNDQDAQAEYFGGNVVPVLPQQQLGQQPGVMVYPGIPSRPPAQQ